MENKSYEELLKELEEANKSIERLEKDNKRMASARENQYGDISQSYDKYKGRKGSFNIKMGYTSLTRSGECVITALIMGNSKIASLFIRIITHMDKENKLKVTRKELRVALGVEKKTLNRFLKMMMDNKIIRIQDSNHIGRGYNPKMDSIRGEIIIEVNYTLAFNGLYRELYYNTENQPSIVKSEGRFYESVGFYDDNNREYYLEDGSYDIILGDIPKREKRKRRVNVVSVSQLN